MPTIERLSLRKQVLEEVRRRILEAELPSGSPIKEDHLAAELGVSRTPLREALHSLAQEGLVVTEPGKGFAINTLTATEAQELYPLRALLEPIALRLSGIPQQEILVELQRLNRELTSTAKGPGWIDTDDRWHRLLVAGCTNSHLLRMIKNLRLHTRRYEYAYFQGVEDGPSLSTRQHSEILTLLAAGDLDQACDQLADNMLVGVDSILRWVQTRTP